MVHQSIISVGCGGAGQCEDGVLGTLRIQAFLAEQCSAQIVTMIWHEGEQAEAHTVPFALAGWTDGPCSVLRPREAASPGAGAAETGLLPAGG